MSTWFKGARMGKYSKEDYEFEKNKQALLSLAKSNGSYKPKEAHERVSDFEIRAHRHQKKRDRFLLFGGVCGIISLIITVILLLNVFYKFMG